MSASSKPPTVATVPLPGPVRRQMTAVGLVAIHTALRGCRILIGVLGLNVTKPSRERVVCTAAPLIGEQVDAELAALMSTAATALVQLLTTDGWERAKSAVGSLWQRVHPDSVATLAIELADSRAALLAAREVGDDQAERDLEGEWRGRLGRLVAADPRVADELPQLLQELRAALSETAEAQTGHIDMRAHASGHARVYQAGRDQHISGS